MPGRRSESVAPSSYETGLFDHVQCDVLRFRCTADAIFEDEGFLDRALNTGNRTELSVQCVACELLSVFALSRAAMLPARYHTYVFLSWEYVRSLRHVGWYHAACNTELGIILRVVWQLSGHKSSCPRERELKLCQVFVHFNKCGDYATQLYFNAQLDWCICSSDGVLLAT